MTRTISTTCPYCGVGCGVRAEVAADGVHVAGDKTHPANFGRLCVKGSSLAQALTWRSACSIPGSAARGRAGTTRWTRSRAVFTQTIAAHGPESVAFYVSGQLLTEDYYVANKLMKGFVGSANIDTNSRLCMSSSVAGHKRAFGSDTVPGCYEDLEQADLVVLVGSNLAWCHPILFQRLAAARAKSRRIAAGRQYRSAPHGDQRDRRPSSALAPGSDVALFSACCAS